MRKPTSPPEPAATDAEKARAQGFSKLVDRVQDGEPVPPALDVGDRALLEVATMVTAAHRPFELDSERARSIVDSALEHAVLGRQTSNPPAAAAPAEDKVVSLAERRERSRRLPWAIAAVAAAAAIVLLVTRPDTAPPTAETVTARTVPEQQRSRPADELVGQIPRDQAGAASARIDAIYSDRMAGYRELSLRRTNGGTQ